MSGESGHPLVSVVVPALNGEDTVSGCLESLLQVRWPPERREVLVVDNGSTDRTAQRARTFPVRVVAEPRTGLTHARNRGIAESRGEIVAFIDADCQASPSWLEELSAKLADGTRSAVSGEIVPLPPTTAAQRWAARRKPRLQALRSKGALPWFSQANAAFRREVFERIGTYDPRFTGVACEDIDLAWRFFDAGLQAAHAPRAVVFHRNRVQVRSLFAQQVHVGRGQAVLQAKYADALPWELQDELSAWTDLLGGVSPRVLLRQARSSGRRGLELHGLDLMRAAAQRYGFLSGKLARATARTDTRSK